MGEERSFSFLPFSIVSTPRTIPLWAHYPLGSNTREWLRDKSKGKRKVDPKEGSEDIADRSVIVETIRTWLQLVTVKRRFNQAIRGEKESLKILHVERCADVSSRVIRILRRFDVCSVFR